MSRAIIIKLLTWPRTGGVQNIGKKEKEGDKKDKDRTSGKITSSRIGFRGLGH